MLKQMQVPETFCMTPKTRSHTQVERGFSSTKPSILVMGSNTNSPQKSHSFQPTHISFHMYWAKPHYFKLQSPMSILIRADEQSF